MAFAIAMGTNYYIRIPEAIRTQYVADLRAKALADAAPVRVPPGDLASYLELRDGVSDIGPSWATGWFLSNDADYIRHAYEVSG